MESTLICRVQTFYHQFHVKRGLVTPKFQETGRHQSSDVVAVPNNFLINSPLFTLIVSFAILFGLNFKQNSKKHCLVNGLQTCMEIYFQIYPRCSFVTLFMYNVSNAALIVAQCRPSYWIFIFEFSNCIFNLLVNNGNYIQ